MYEHSNWAKYEGFCARTQQENATILCLCRHSGSGSFGLSIQSHIERRMKGPVAPASTCATPVQFARRPQRERERESLSTRSYRWQGTAALFGMVSALLMPSTPVLAKDLGGGQEKATVSVGAQEPDSGHLPMPKKPFTLPEDHALRLASIG